MWQRIKTALVLVVLVAAAMFSGSVYAMMALLALMVLVAGFEWGRLVPNTSRTHALLLSGWCFLLSLVLMVFLLGYVALATFCALLCSFMLIYWVVNYPNKTHQWYNGTLFVLGAVMLPATAAAMFYLWSLSPWWLLYVFLLVWCADSGAYFVGRKWGRRKLAPNVSPNKSIEGLVGGVAVGTLVALTVTAYFANRWGVGLSFGFALLSLVVIVLSVFGDLGESMMKRKALVKDSGTILPGHGGVLDRIDSQLSAMPAFALGFYWLQMMGIAGGY